MNPQDAIDFSREAIMTCMMVGGPILVAGLLIGLLTGVFQAMTQVQDQTVSFVPKILLLLLMIGLCLPWLTDKMLDFAKQSFETPMMHWDGTDRPVFYSEAEPATATSEAEQPIATANPNDLLASYSGPPAIQFQQAAFVSPSPTANAKLNTGTLPDFQATYVPPKFAPQTKTTQPPTVATEPDPPANPFVLPHYRFSKVPKDNIDG